jgi:thioesterase domain-containing protein
MHDCTVIEGHVKTDVLRTMLADRMALVRQRVATQLEDLQAHHTIFETTSDVREHFLEVAGWEREVFNRDEFRMLMSMTSLDAVELTHQIEEIISDDGIAAPEGFRIAHNSQSWSSRDDGGTDHTLVLELAKVSAAA